MSYKENRESIITHRGKVESKAPKHYRDSNKKSTSSNMLSEPLKLKVKEEVKTMTEIKKTIVTLKTGDSVIEQLRQALDDRMGELSINILDVNIVEIVIESMNNPKLSTVVEVEYIVR